MSNVIKQRQLKNEDKLTPKTDFLGFSSDEVNYHYGAWNLDGTEKLNRPYSSAYGAPISVGKGQVLTFGASGPSNTYSMVLKNKKTGATVKSKVIDTYAGDENVAIGGRDYYNEYKIVEFIGKPFENGDRHIILNYNTGIGYRPALFNIDKWEIVDVDIGGGNSNIWHSFIYDGVDKGYCVLKQNGVIYQLNLLEDRIGFTQLLDDSGNSIPALRVYGMTDEFIVFQDFDGTAHNVKTFNRNTKEIVSLGFRNTDFLEVFMTKDTLLYYNEALNDIVVLDQVFGGDGKTLPSMSRPLLILERKPITPGSTITTLSYIGTNGSDTFYRSDLTITPAAISERTDTVLENIPFPSNGRYRDVFRYTCNSKGVGDFYTYGLQKQWDNMIEAKNGKM